MRDPATGLIAGTVLLQGAPEVEAAVQRARAAQAAWALLSVKARCAALRAARRAFVAARREIIALLARETGKPRFGRIENQPPGLVRGAADTLGRGLGGRGGLGF